MVSHRMQEAAHEDDVDLIITADTIVVLDDEVIGKPIDAADAAATLARLSDRSHRVVSAIVLLVPRRRTDATARQARSGDEALTIVASESTEVHFASLSESEIAAYVQTGDPLYVVGAAKAFASWYTSSLIGWRLWLCFVSIETRPVRMAFRAWRRPSCVVSTAATSTSWASRCTCSPRRCAPSCSIAICCSCGPHKPSQQSEPIDLGGWKRQVYWDAQADASNTTMVGIGFDWIGLSG